MPGRIEGYHAALGVVAAVPLWKTRLKMIADQKRRDREAKVDKKDDTK